MKHLFLSLAIAVSASAALASESQSQECNSKNLTRLEFIQVIASSEAVTYKASINCVAQAPSSVSEQVEKHTRNYFGP